MNQVANAGQIRDWKARMDFASAVIALENIDAADDPALQRKLAEALAMEEHSRVWRTDDDRERVAATISELKLRRSRRLRAANPASA